MQQSMIYHNTKYSKHGLVSASSQT